MPDCARAVKLTLKITGIELRGPEPDIDEPPAVGKLTGVLADIDVGTQFVEGRKHQAYWSG